MLALALLCAAIAPAQAQEQAQVQAQDGSLSPGALASRLDALIDGNPQTRRTTVALTVVDLENGMPVYSRNAEDLLVPASVQKLVTSAAALDLLGPETRQTHRLALLGRWRAPGVFAGDLAIETFSDPMFSDADLAAMVQQLVQDTGLVRLEGRITLGGLDWPEGKGPGWMWDDEPAAFSAPVSKAVLNRNTVRVRVAPQAGDGVRVTLVPQTDYPPIVRIDPPPALSASARAALAPAARAAYDRSQRFAIERLPGTDAVRIVGRNAPARGQELTLGIKDPGAYLLGVTRALLARAGVDVSAATALRIAADPRAPLAAQVLRPGASVAQAVHEFNRESENIIGEVLLLMLAQRFGELPTWAEGARVIGEWLTARTGAPEDAFRLMDGSGLSRYNLMSADVLTRLLASMTRHAAFPVYFDSLPRYRVVLERGTRFDGKEASAFDAQRIVAKPGGMAGVATIAGYLQTFDGRWLAFAMLTNGNNGTNRHARALRNDIWAELVRYRPSGAGPPRLDIRPPARADAPLSRAS